MSRYANDPRVTARPGVGFTVTTTHGRFQVVDLHAENLAWTVLAGDAVTVETAAGAVCGYAHPDDAFDVLLGGAR